MYRLIPNPDALKTDHILVGRDVLRVNINVQPPTSSHQRLPIAARLIYPSNESDALMTGNPSFPAWEAANSMS